MVAFVFFWSAFWGIFWFVLTVFFRLIMSTLNAILSTLGKVFKVVGVILLVSLVLFLLVSLISGIINGTLMDMLGSLLITAVSIGIMILLFGSLGAALFELAVTILTGIFAVIEGIILLLVEFCESRFRKAFTPFINKMDKC